jgi:thioredoxin-like negative regulator of GroEL
VKWLIIILLFSFFTNAQTMLTDKNFDNSQVGVTVVEFWADWNAKNECTWLEDLEDAEVYRIDLNTDAAKDNEITVLPTVIVFNDGQEIKRFEGNISFSLCSEETPKKVQKQINELMLDKF